jgi:outer membrane protein assembly factor BamD (BamD/ComL family)
MSVTSVATSSLFQPYVTQGVQNKFQQIQSQFQQLGQDLQAGNLTQAQQDFAALQQNLPNAQQQSGTTTSGIAQAFEALGQDLQSGNLAAAQQDFAAIQQDAQQQQSSGQVHHHHHRHASESSSSQQDANNISQAFGALGQALQSGNLSSAQQAYATLQQDFESFLPNSTAGAGTSTSTAAPVTSGALSVNA